MITKKLKALVISEATKLKEHATPKELEKLNPLTLKGSDSQQCPYGQMTGTCFSQRAEELVNKCGVLYSLDLFEIQKPPHELYRWGGVHDGFSAMEFYTAQEGNKADRLIAFLKGKTETLEL